jgi:hypothetical protein
MYALHRRPEVCSIGYYVNDRVGKPTKDTGQHWVQRCNFVFHVIGKVISCKKEALSASVDHNSGWILEAKMMGKNPQIIYMKNDDAAANASMKKVFLKSLPGCICRMTNDDFWSMVDYDCRQGIKTCYAATHCGKVKLPHSETVCWIFPEILLGHDGKKLTQQKLFINLETLKKRENGDRISLPSTFPVPQPVENAEKCRVVLHNLGKKLIHFYGPTTVHAVHIICATLKAINRDIIMKEEHQVSVMNVSGPANIGKTLACAIALKMMGADSLMLSRCTPSAMLDYTEMFRNMLIVWDDPRDCAPAQFCAIVHEAFHGHKTSSISRGNRSYNSSLIIGTQEKCLGLPQISANLPTFSRLSHIDFACSEDKTFQADRADEEELQNVLKHVNCFGFLLNLPYNKDKIDKLHDKLLSLDSNCTIIPRSLRNLAIDWFFARQMNTLLNIPPKIIDEYFCDFQINYLMKHCSNVNPFQLFCTHVVEMLRNHKIPANMLKRKVMVDIQHYGALECVAIYQKEFFPYMLEHIPESRLYSQESITAEIKMSKGTYGEISKNVSFKLDNGAQLIRRSMVIRTNVLFNV